MNDNSGSNEHAELIWIYEVLTKDLEWALHSIEPEKSILIILQKLTLRKTFFHTPHRAIKSEEKEEIKNELTPQKVIDKNLKIDDPDTKEEKTSLGQDLLVKENLIDDKKEIPPIENKIRNMTKTWDDFIHDLFKKRPALALNVEQGNILDPLNISKDKLFLKIYFKNSEKVFYDYLLEKDSFSSLRESIRAFFDYNESELDVSLNILSEEHESYDTFLSFAEMEKEKEKKILNNKKEKFLDNSFIKQAQKLFNSQIDKMIMND